MDGDNKAGETATTVNNLPVTEEALKFPERSSDKQDLAKGKKKEVANSVPFHKLFLFADSTDYALMFIGAITAVGSGISFPLMTLILGDLVDTFGGTVDTTKVVHAVSMVALEYVYLALGSGVAAVLQVVCWNITGERQAARIRCLYLKAILRQDVAFFDIESRTGEVVERLSADTVIIQGVLTEKVGKFMQLVSTFLGGFVIAFVKGWLLALVLMSSIPCIVIASGMMTIFLGKLMTRGQAAYIEAANVVEQTVGSIRTVASFTGERQAISKFDESLDTAYLSGVKEGLAAGLGAGIYMLVLYNSYALAVWFGGRMILHKNYTAGEAINVIIAVLTGSISLGQASPCLTAFAAGQVAACKIYETLNRIPEIDSFNPKGRKLDDINGDVELRDVYFSYPSRPNELIFNGLHLTVPSGTTTALVGYSGSGKSTVISLIERFYDPQAGEVLIDHINLKDFQLRWIRSRIGLVSQEPVLFASSIKENIAYGKDGATLEEIKAAAELSNAAKFIDSLPQGLDTLVGVHGTQMSGGQKQRIAIARAIVKNPKILLLDEATSALDVESERTVQEALDRLMVSRTTLVVAHRLSTVKNADTIAVIYKGNIVERGSNSELLQDPKGAYSQLVKLQRIGRVPEQQVATLQDIPDSSTTNSERHPRQQISEIGTISTRLSETSINDSHSLTGRLGVPSSTIVSDKATADTPSDKLEKFTLRRLAYLNKPEIPVLIVGFLAALANGIILPTFGLLFSSIIKTFYESGHKLQKDSEFWALMFVGLGVASFVAMPLRTYCFAVAGCKLIRRLRLMCFEKVIHMEISWFDKLENSSGAIGARLSADASAVKGIVGDALGFLVQIAATAIAGLVIGFQASWQLSTVLLVMLPLVGLNGYFQIKSFVGFHAKSKKLYEDASQFANDAVGSIRTVSSFCAEDKIVQLYKKKSEGPLRAGIRQGFITGSGIGISMFLLFSVYATCFYAGARFLEAGKIKVPEIFQVFFGLTMTAVGISQSGALAPDTGKAKSAAASIFALLDQKSLIESRDDNGITVENMKGDIEFQHVNFVYPTRPDFFVFRDFCLIIPCGQTVALVGESGSGKSTVISLSQRFYDPDSGNITIDGINIQDFKLKWLRQQMGLVSQEPVLFNDSIKFNIAYGMEGNATDAEILAAAKLANAHNFISALQQGYDTRVGERGIQLSGGQKQRVAIARAILKNPKILLLDEATSALDSESEKVVQEALDKIMAERRTTTVVVAHRLSTVKNADLIVVVKNGLVEEKGKHEELMNVKDGIYSFLVSCSSAC
ncbi:hypothetical protein DCAR_0935341 [Daucus carota subsp. sativus]|uniref:MDR-like ABC transporter n=1 Tax=Daucus carota subsp. sativus TaxID=79200 RepID=A0A175YJ08_DAUCS|nr:PREDICTED: ABC transporter B family member 3-like [Daucus carota subsp. sativus]WOH15795.1 hypothetical protein DCAR_0935341 [Daucus carota subsp. sativus]